MEIKSNEKNIRIEAVFLLVRFRFDLQIACGGNRKAKEIRPGAGGVKAYCGNHLHTVRQLGAFLLLTFLRQSFKIKNSMLSVKLHARGGADLGFRNRSEICPAVRRDFSGICKASQPAVSVKSGSFLLFGKHIFRA